MFPRSLLLCGSIALGFVSQNNLRAQTTQTWNTNTAAATWSDTASWTPAAAPGGNNLIFGDAFGETANATTVGNVVDNDFIINSLTYNNTGTTGNFWQVTQIAPGKTLTLDAGVAPASILNVGGIASQSTRVAITGSGTLTINEATSNVDVTTPTANQSAILDMSGLSNFNASVAAFNFGTNRGNGDVNLAANNNLTAGSMALGSAITSTGGGSKSDLRLGTTNLLNLDTISVGLNFASGTIAYQSGLTNPTTTLRGSLGGTSRTNLTIANTNVIGVSNAQGSSVDFGNSGGSVDARVDQLLIGRRGDGGSELSIAGSMSMAKGNFDTNTVVLGTSAGIGALANNVTGNLTVSGGTFLAGSITMADNSAGATSAVSNLTVSGTGAVTVSGDIITGTRAGTASNVTATIVVSGGTLLVQGNLAEGTNPAAITSSVTVSGGTLNMDHGSLSVDTFSLTSGRLKNVTSFQAATSGGLAVQNASKLSYDIDAGLTTLDLTGTLSLGATSELELTLANGLTPGSSYLLLSNDSTDGIIGSFLTLNGGAFGPGNTFSISNNLGSFNYQLSYLGGTGNDLVIQAVPEPDATTLLLAAVIGLVVLRRPRRIH